MSAWTSGNELKLLENGEGLFPRLFDAIDAARKEVLPETFIWYEDDVGRSLPEAVFVDTTSAIRRPCSAFSRETSQAFFIAERGRYQGLTPALIDASFTGTLSFLPAHNYVSRCGCAQDPE